MKPRFKTPLWIKLLIAIGFWALFYYLLSLISDNEIYQWVIWCSGGCVLIYNILILCVTHNRIKKGDDDLPSAISKYKPKNNEPWAI